MGLVALALSEECLGGRVEGAEDAHDLGLAHAETAEPVGDRRRVRGVLRSEAAVATPVEARAQGAAARLGHRTEARGPVGDGDAHVPATLALDAHAVRRYPRLAFLDRGGEHLEQ